MLKNQSVVTRFAPSPTGFMHIGGARTALYAWLFARHNRGRFILRIEDTDKEREVPGSIDHIIESLQWLGIDWDEGPDIGGPNAPYLQSKRLDSYKKYALMLLDKGLAYADPYTDEEMAEFRKQSELEKKPFLYRDYRPANPPAWDGSKPLRLKISEPKTSQWTDLVRGPLQAGPEALDDFILIKSDGYPTYNFAHIIDDLSMGVTHILRADEFISSTPKFLALYDALGIERPHFVTLPPIMGPDGKKKLGKRDGARDLLDYKSDGFLPSAVANFLALIGWNPGDDREIFSMNELIDIFDISKIHTAGGQFNEEKMRWMNKEYMKLIDDEEFVKQISAKTKQLRLDTTLTRKLCPIIREKISVWGDIDKMVALGELSYFKDAPTIQKEGLICPAKLRKDKPVSYEDIRKHLAMLNNNLEHISDADWNEDNIKDCVWDYATTEGRGIVLWAMRYALSGKEKSPDPFMIAYILGKDETMGRLQNASKL